jgi:hypothetical protein
LRNTTSMSAVMRTNATIDARVESRIDWAVSSASMAGMPVTPHFTFSPLAATTFAIRARRAARSELTASMRPSLGAS